MESDIGALDEKIDKMLQILIENTNSSKGASASLTTEKKSASASSKKKTKGRP